MLTPTVTAVRIARGPDGDFLTTVKVPTTRPAVQATGEPRTGFTPRFGKQPRDRTIYADGTPRKA